jgi:hypothetical protein
VPQAEKTLSVITRAIFVLTSPEAGEQFLRVLPDLREIGLSEAMILHLVSAQPGPAEPMPELANWVRHFEVAIPRVELALKRGDPIKWIHELARVRHVDIVVISGIPNGTEWDFERVSSPLRSLGIPILFLPDEEIEAPLQERVLVGVKAPEMSARAVAGLKDWLRADHLRAIRVARSEGDGGGGGGECSGVRIETVSESGDVATTLLQQAESCGATLLTILTEKEGDAVETGHGMPVVKPLIETTDRPVLIWPAGSSPP